MRTRRVLLVLLAGSAGSVGLWGALAPRDWYRSFPGLGMHWLVVLGPYNEHLSRDVAGLYLALLVFSVGAALRAYDGYLVRLVAGAWVAFSVPHLLYHLGHLDMYGTRDQILNSVLLGGTVMVAGALLLAPGVRPRVVQRVGGR